MMPVKLIAFYLPQFHPIPENDAWWGKGFTEWTNVVRAQPNYAGHYQPHLPADLGFYDLRLDAARAEQAALARAYGIEGFCYYYYWFGGKRLLEQPIEAMLAGGEPGLPFCLCWANENWTRRWNGDEHDVLIAQRHSTEDDLAIIEDMARYFADPRYIRVDGRPILLVYRLDILPDPAATVRRWREACARLGVGDPYLCAVQSFGITDPTVYGFDAAVEFPPHGVVAAELEPEAKQAQFRGRAFSYGDAARYALAKPTVPYPRFRGVMPSWDNTPRKQRFGHCYQGSHPLAYRAWLAEAIADTRANARLPAPLVFINAWNEWGEGCHLEPDLRYGHRWLEATRAAHDLGPAPVALREQLFGGELADELQAQISEPWSALQLGTPGQALVLSWKQRLFLLLRYGINRHPKVKLVIRPVARLLGWVD